MPLALPDSDLGLSRRLLSVGFLFALILSSACLALAGYYLIEYLSLTSNAIDSILRQSTLQPGMMQLAVTARLAVAKYSLSSCGAVCGLAFGFLGFALFLLGIRGDMDAGGQLGSQSIQLARIAPGTFVITCAAILIGISVTHSIDVQLPASYSISADQRAASSIPVYVAPDSGETDRKP